MKEISLDGKYLQRTGEGHLYLMQMLDFPAYYGKNMDALYDLLTEIAELVTLRIENSEAMDSQMRRVFQEAALDNEGVLFVNFVDK